MKISRIITPLLAAALLLWLTACTELPVVTTHPAASSGTALESSAYTEPTQPSVTTEPTEPAASTTPTTTAPNITEPEPTSHSHIFTDWEQTQEPDCTHEGSAIRSCACGEMETQILSATGHRWDAGTVTAAPVNCKDTGTITYRCQRCGANREKSFAGDHSFGPWAYEEYTYIIPADPPHLPDESVITSHRQVRTCTGCGARETDGTPEHSCRIGSGKHKVTVLDPGDCTHKKLMRSTCTVCGWYTDYEGGYGKHVWGQEEHIHVSDYGPYTNELDLDITPCDLCGYQIYQYTLGRGYQDVQTQNAAYRFSITNKHYSVYQQEGTAFATGVGTLYQFAADDEKTKEEANRPLLYPDRQTVYRNPVYDSEGMLLQFDISWYDTVLEKRCTYTLVIADIPTWYSDENNEFYNGSDESEYILFFGPGYLWPAAITRPFYA